MAGGSQSRWWKMHSASGSLAVCRMLCRMAQFSACHRALSFVWRVPHTRHPNEAENDPKQTVSMVSCTNARGYKACQTVMRGQLPDAFGRVDASV